MKYLKPPYPEGNGPHMSQWMQNKGLLAQLVAFRGNLSRLMLARAQIRQLWT